MNWAKTLTDKLISRLSQMVHDLQQDSTPDRTLALYLISCLQSLSSFAQPHLEFILNTTNLDLISDYSQISQMIKSIIKKLLIPSITQELSEIASSNQTANAFLLNGIQYVMALQNFILSARSRNEDE